MSLSFRDELRPMVRLAAPIALAEVGWMAMGIVDTIMVGHLPDSAVAIGAVSLGTILFYALGMFGSGLSLGLDTLVSHAFGRGDLVDCRRSLVNAVYFSIPLALVLMALVWGLSPLLEISGVNPAVMRATVPYLRVLNWSMPPLLLYFALRRYLQGMSLVAPVTFALVSANLVNVAGNWILVYGHLGAPALGTPGSAWATLGSRIYMAGVLLAFAIYHDRTHQAGAVEIPWRPDFARIRELIRLGFPAASQIGLETAIFAAAAWLIGRLDAASLAGHQIALNTVALTYMVPLGIGSAGAVRVGQSLGRGDPDGARHAGWMALSLGVAFMTCSAVVLLAFPRRIALLYSSDEAVLKVGVSLLIIAAFFQIFDGFQVVATGVLRGAGDTRTPMYCHLIGYYAFGLPLGCLLCFGLGWGARGLWMGLSAAIISIGCALLLIWLKRTKSDVIFLGTQPH
jgi:MATE family multidrug resistance protein